MAGSNELALSGGGKIASTVSDALTKPLLELCEISTDAHEAVVAIRDAGLLKQARDAWPIVKMLAAPITSDEIYRELQPLIVMFGNPEFSKDEQGTELEVVWWKIFLKVLGGLPKEAVAHAVSEWLRHGYRGWPSTSQLYKLAEPVASKARMLAYRVRKAAEYQEERDNRTPADEIKQVGQGFGALADELRGIKAKQIPQAGLVRPTKPNDALVKDLVAQGLKASSVAKTY